MLLAAAAGPPPQGPGFTILLVLHLAAVAASLVTVTAAGVHGRLVASPGQGGRDEAVRRYFRPGADISGRVLYAVPATGLALVALSGGRFGMEDRFVIVGSVLWLAAAVVAELVLWPAVRLAGVRLATEPGLTVAASASPAPEVVDPPGPSGSRSGDLGRLGRRIVGGAAVVAAMVLAASVVMVLKP